MNGNIARTINKLDQRQTELMETLLGVLNVEGYDDLPVLMGVLMGRLESAGFNKDTASKDLLLKHLQDDNIAQIVFASAYCGFTGAILSINERITDQIDGEES